MATTRKPLGGLRLNRALLLPAAIAAASLALRLYWLGEQSFWFDEAQTLCWQAINEAPVQTSYAVFTHLLDPREQVIAQHDGLPGGGAWPTTAWARGQAIVGERDLTFREGDYQGDALVETGLYDAASFQRLATPDGADRVILPIRIAVLP